MTVRVYRSTDVGAPTLTGQAGTFLTLLDAVLVGGYGSSVGAGWTKPYSNTNIGVYRTGTGNQRYLRIDDSGTTDARAHSFEAMTSDSAYTNCFTIALGTPGAATGHAIKKSSTADTVARGWLIVATQSAFYCFIEPTSTPTTWEGASTSTSGNGQFFFGDFISYRPNDVYNTATLGATSTTNGNGTFAACSNSISSTGATGHYICRSYLGLGQGGAPFHKGIPGQYNGTTTMGSSSTSNTYPDPLTGGILLTQVELAEIANGAHVVRGRLPGLWTSISSLAAAHGDIISGTGVVAGKTLLCVAVYNTSTVGRAFVEISDTW